VKSPKRRLRPFFLSTLTAICAIPAVMVGITSDAGAGEGSRDSLAQRLPRLTRLHEAIGRANGPFAYAALRRVWREWDQGDPSEVDEVIREVAADPKIAPPVRAYAELLEAYARRRRGDLDGARARIASLGYVSRWLVVGPFDNEGKGGFDRAFGPEDDRMQPVSLARGYDGKERPVRWRVAPSVSPFGWFDLGVFLRPAEKSCGYATTFVRDGRSQKAPKGIVPARPISIWAGSAGAMKIWWNGAEVIKDEKYRQIDSDRFASEVTLKEGWNRLLVKVCGDDDGPMLALRLAGRDGSPDANIEIDDDPARSIEAKEASKGKPTPPLPPPAGPRGIEGPMQAFERLSKSGDAATLEGFARYLVLTQSDDPSDKRARELARKAAEKAPTIPRLLLAGDLAEGRNQRASWIEKAEAIAKGAPEDEKMDVLLARAAHARGGSNWRDAIPYYERALAADPDDVTATLARFELYSEAGLRETALTFLQKALARRPRSVALVRATVGALREQDRTTEADEMQARYAQLRFDDPSIARGGIDMAVANRDAAAANRWIERFLATNPDSAGALAVAAKAYLALGDRPRAVAMYKRALDLAPEDTETMQQLADAYALGGRNDEQLKLLRRILELKPQAKEVREYVAHSEPSKPRPDEVYARPSAEFLAKRGAPAAGQNRRTLVDLQVTTVFPNGLASRFHQIVFQPLTDSAAAQAREYAFGYEANTEAVQLRGAHIYRGDGRVDEAIESGEGAADNPSLSTYTSARAYYVHFPRLHAGDVVELQYRVEDVAPRNAFADYFGEVTYMQSSEPVARAEYVLITPKSRTFYFNKPNVPGLVQSVEESGDLRVYKFLAQNVPALTPEALQPPWSETLGHVHVSTYKTWDDMGRWYWGLVKDQFVADDEVRRRVAEVTKGLKDDREKVRAVYDYVVQKTRYVALEFGIHGFKPYRCAQIFARGFGDCKDKATLIVTMLKELGIQATIVIVRTQNKGDFETDPASLAPFDHAIAYVPSLDLYLDGTAEWTGSTELPAMDRNALALQVNEGKPKLVHLPDPPASESVVSKKIEATIGDNGSSQIDWKTDVTGVSASSWRARYHAEATKKQRIQEDLGAEFAGLELTTLDTNNMEDIEKPVTVHARGKVTQFARREGEALSIPVGPAEHMVREFASLSQRKQDIRLYAQSTNENDWTLRLPAGAKVVTAPRPEDADSPFGHFKLEVEASGNTVHVKSTMTLTRLRIAGSEYAAFRAWCERVDKALGQRLVVSK
jgi:tetratricopeptide (TPR) repeat protein/transglutaminase-like putative cysteine protease